MKYLLAFTLILFQLFTFSSTSFCSTRTTTPESEKVLFEITDKYNEVKLGITKTSVFMQFSNSIKEISNKNYENYYQLDAYNFEDSDGNFIPSTITILESNKIEFSFDEISSVSFSNGKLEFKFTNDPSISFEDIYSYNGTKAIQNFYVEDLEAFIISFQTRFN